MLQRTTVLAPWTQTDAAVEGASHKSTLQHLNFLEKEFVAMMQKGGWILLPYKSVRGLSS